MGEPYLEESCLSPELLARGLSLREGDVLLLAGPGRDTGSPAESAVEMILLTDEEGFAEKARRLAPGRRGRQVFGKCGTLIQRVGTADLEVHVLLRASLEVFLESLHAEDPWGGEEGAAGLGGGVDPDLAVELLHRLRKARPLVNGEAFEAMRGRLCPKRLAAWGVNQALFRTGDAMAGTLSSLEQNDVENAYLKLADLYDALGDAVLYSKGQSADRWKWRLPKLRAFGPTPFVDRYLDVKLPRRPPSEPLGAFVERHLSAANDVVERLRREARIGPPS